MQPYEIVRRKVIKVAGEFRLAPEDVPVDVRTWTGYAAFVPGDPVEIKKRVAAIRISFTADVIPDAGGAWVMAGHSDLMKIVKALR